MTKQQRYIPELRFPEFENDGEWDNKQIADIADSKNSSIALNKLDLKDKGFTVYGADGIIGFIEDFQQKEPYISIVKDGSGVGRLNLCEPKSSILGTLAFIQSKNDDKYLLNWIYYLLNTIDFRKYIKGAGIPHIYFSNYKVEKIGVPKPIEQQKIADCLSSLDELITAHEEKLALLQDHKKGLLQNLFPAEGQKVPNYHFPEFKNEGEWVEKSLTQVADYKNGKAHEKDIVEQGKYIVVNSKFISSDGEEIKYTHNPNCLASMGDILMVLSDVPNGKAIAKCFYVDEDEKYTVNQRICRITPFDCNNVLLYYIMNRNRYFLAFDDGVKQTNLRKKVVLDFPFRIPQSPNEQQKIADTLSSLDELITAETEKIEQLKDHKKGLMQGLFPKIN